MSTYLSLDCRGTTTCIFMAYLSYLTVKEQLNILIEQ